MSSRTSRILISLEWEQMYCLNSNSSSSFHHNNNKFNKISSNNSNSKTSQSSCQTSKASLDSKIPNNNSWPSNKCTNSSNNNKWCSKCICNSSNSPTRPHSKECQTLTATWTWEWEWEINMEQMSNKICRWTHFQWAATNSWTSSNLNSSNSTSNTSSSSSLLSSSKCRPKTTEPTRPRVLLTRATIRVELLLICLVECVLFAF